MKEYKLWVTLEEYNDKTGEYRDIGEPLDIGTFKSRKDAQKCLDIIEDVFMGRDIREKMCDMLIKEISNE